MVNLDIWGKTLQHNKEVIYYPLLCHMLDSVATMAILYDNWLSDNLKDYLKEQFNGDHAKAKQAALFAAGVHDLGKASPVFQGALLNPRGNRDHESQIEILKNLHGLTFPSMEDEDIASLRVAKLHRHEKIGYWLLTNREKDINSQIGQNWLQTIVLGHHGSYEISYGNPRSNTHIKFLERTMTEDWVTEANNHISALELAIGVNIEELKSIKISHEAVILLSGLVVLADRLASNENSVSEAYDSMIGGSLDILNPKTYVEQRKPFLKKLAKKEIGFKQNISQENVLGDYSPRGVQTKVPGERGLWLVMAPTGAGKTEAALLRHVKYNENLIFLLPTRSTTDAMFGRLKEVFKNLPETVSSTLAHGDAYLNDFYSQKRGFNPDHGDCGSGLVPAGLTNAGAKLSSSLTVGTIDQMVMGGLPLKWSHLRLLTLANAHIVIDEAHLMDPYQMTLIKEVFSFLGKVNSNLTILSATLPTSLKQNIINSYNNEDSYDGIAEFPSHDIQPLNKSEIFQAEPYTIATTYEDSSNPINTHVTWAKKTISKYPKSRLGIFVNTVDRCQKIAIELQKELPDAQVICLHSRMMGKHRKETVEKLLKLCGTKNGKGERIILVGTQVIEMSLDIDLDIISTDICPAPSFIQRAGRAWRDKSPIGFERRYERIKKDDFPHLPVNIVSSIPKNDKDKPYLPYERSVIERTIDFIKINNNLHFPDSIQDFVETSVFSMFDVDDAEIPQEEISGIIFKELKASSVKSRILNFINATTTVEQAGSLTSSQLDDEVATRLIEGQFQPLIIVSDDPDLIAMGAIDSNISVDKLNDLQLKAASVGINAKIEKELKNSSIELLKLGNRTFAYFGELPASIVYSKENGLLLV